MTDAVSELTVAVTRLAAAIETLTAALAVAPLRAPQAAAGDPARGAPPLVDGVMADFIGDCVEEVPGGSIQGRAFYEAYVVYSTLARGTKPLSERVFSERMQELLPDRLERGRVRLWHDLVLKSPPAAP